MRRGIVRSVGARTVVSCVKVFVVRLCEEEEVVDRAPRSVYPVCVVYSVVRHRDKISLGSLQDSARGIMILKARSIFSLCGCSCYREMRAAH